MDSMDWNAAISSEVFRNYMAEELRKEASQKKTAEEELDIEVEVLQDFEKFERQVNASPRLRGVFVGLQRKFATDPEYAAKAHPLFVEGVMMLKLED